MNRKKYLQEQHGVKLKELEAIHQGAEKRSFTAEETTRVDSLAAEVESIKAEISREDRSRDLLAGQKPLEQGSESLGLSEKELRKFSLLRAVNMLAAGKAVDGLEGEVSTAEARRLGRDPQGFFVPAEVFAGASSERRNRQQVTPASDGGYTVGTDVDYANMVELLRNQSHIMAAGARVITGLRGDVTIPRVLTGATAYWVSETGTITGSKATFGQIASKPRRIGASVPYTKQFLAQSGIGAEAFVRDDMFAAFGTELDRVAINGAGAAEPLGILNLASGDRATGVTFGAAPTWAKVVSFETNVETANALALPGARYSYLTTPGVKGAWKTAAKIAGQAQWLWENGDIVNGYAARSTNQVPSNRVIFGDFGQVLYMEWTGIDVTVDALTLAKSGQVEVTIQKYVDVVVRQGRAFSVSSDAGNQ